MRQYRWGLLLCTFILLLQSCTKSITGEGPIVTENRQTPMFTKVKVNGSSDLEIVQAPNLKVIVTGYGNLLNIYESTVDNGELLLGFKTRYNIKNDNIKVRIETPDIRGVNINGSGDIRVSGFANGIALNSIINGSGSIRILNSAFDTMNFLINGSGDILSATVVTKNAEATIQGSGNIFLNCTQSLKLRIYGSGNIDYYGNPVNTDISINGSGTARKK